MIKLGVNVDHIATVRQARMTFEPDPVAGAALADLAGADVITIHLREDRRHIQDRDLEIMRKTVYTKLNLEMALSDEIIDIALKTKPDQVTFVPEKRQEVTTEGGLDVISNKNILPDIVKKFKDAGILVSFFIDPDQGQIAASKDTGAEYVELHTGTYANAGTDAERAPLLEKLATAGKYAEELGIKVNAGHGLTYKNTGALIDSMDIEELHIGHSIISRSIFVGIKEAVREMKELIYQYESLK